VLRRVATTWPPRIREVAMICHLRLNSLVYTVCAAVPGGLFGGFKNPHIYAGGIHRPPWNPAGAQAPGPAASGGRREGGERLLAGVVAVLPCGTTV
jgi:hypothetical protein